MRVPSSVFTHTIRILNFKERLESIIIRKYVDVVFPLQSYKSEDNL